MKLQKQLSRRVGKTDYPKWVVTIPPSIVKEVGWKEGETLEARLEKNRLILFPKKS